MHKCRLLSLFAVAAAVLAGAPAALASSGTSAAHGPRITTHRLTGAERAAAVRSGIAAAARTPDAGYGAGQALSATDALADSDGATHVRFARTYKRLAVLGGDIVVHQSAGKVSVSGTRRSPLSLSTTPKITAKQAAEAAGDPDADATLVVDATQASPALAWDVVRTGTQADQTPSRQDVLVDAKTGAVRSRTERIATADGDGQSLYGGTVPLSTTAATAGYQLKDATRGGTYTGDAKNQTDFCLLSLCLSRAPGKNAPMTDADNHWGNGTTSDRASAAVDAQYGTNMTWDYYLHTFGRTGIGNDGKGSYNRVHYGSNYVNAFWDDSCFCMTYGDGDSTYGPLVALDVAGHEMTHGVTSRTAALTYSGESGGLNESTSDIFGTMVEFYANNATEQGNYLIGETFSPAGHPLRRMDNPASDGSSANCWSSSVGSLDVHYSSGVGNHWFYLVSEGSGQKSINGVSYDSPTCNGSTVSGIGRDAAAAIWYRTLTVYLTSSSNYAAARTGSLKAAADLYGAGSPEQQGVAAAWSAVSVN